MRVERDLIGMCFRSKSNWDKVTERGITPHSFIDPICGLVFSAMLKSFEDTGTVDAIAIAERVDERTREHVLQMRADAPLTMNILALADEVRTQKWLHDAHQAMRELSERITTRREFEAAEKLKADIQDKLDELTLDAPVVSGPVSTVQAAEMWLNDVEQRMERNEVAGIPTGLRGLDMLLNGGWNKRELYVLGGRPGRGKTTLGITCALAAAASGRKSLFATVEMSAQAIVTKFVSNVTRIKAGKFRSLNLSDEDMDATITGCRKLAEMPLWIDDHWQGQIETLRLDMKRLQQRSGLDIVFVDYIGLINIRGEYPSKHERMGKISKALKNMATEFNIPVVVMAQLNREAEKYDVPGKEHLADCDEIGRDADGVICIYRDKSDQTYLNVDKNRWGREGHFPVEADLAHNAFRDININWGSLD